MSEKVANNEFFCWRVAEAYCYYLMKHNRDLVYHHMFGDIEINQHFIAGLLDGRLKQKFSKNGQAMFYYKLLKSFDRGSRSSVIFVGGKAPELNARGIRYLNTFLRYFGMMLIDLGIRNSDGSFSMPDKIPTEYS